MRKIDRPTFDLEDFLEKLVAERQRGPNDSFFNKQQPNLLQAWNDYEAEIRSGVLSITLSDWTKRKKTLKNLYLSPDDFVADAMRTLREETAGSCPFCGALEAVTLDHFLPKDLYPQFSVLLDNLVVCCGDCNGAKDTVVAGAKGERFFHPYFDKSIGKRMLKMKVEVIDEMPKFSITPTRDLKTPIKRRVLFHIKKLKIQRRLYKLVKAHWKGLATYATRNHGNLDRRKLKNHIKDRMLSELDTFGTPNVVSYLVFEAVLHSSEALNLLLEKANN